MTDDRRTFIVMAEGEAQAAAGNITNTYVTVSCTPCPHCEQRLLTVDRTICRECDGQRVPQLILSVAGLALINIIILFQIFRTALGWLGAEGPNADRVSFQLGGVLAVLASISIHQGLHINVANSFKRTLKKIRSAW